MVRGDRGGGNDDDATNPASGSDERGKRSICQSARRYDEGADFALGQAYSAAAVTRSAA
jgi:hypothetical protein